MTQLSAHDLSVAIGGRTLFSGLNFSACGGEVWGILGANGCGKTTLLHTLSGLRPPLTGEVRIDDSALAELSRRQVARRLAILLQDAEDSFPGEVLETVLAGRHPHIPLWQWESNEDTEIALRALAAVQLEELAGRGLDTLSGGERRRVDVARLLAQETDILLLDEPTNHLDLHHQINILDLLIAGTRERNTCLIMVLHDINLAARYCDRIMLMKQDGQICHGDKQQMLQPDLLEQVYQYPLKLIRDGGYTAYLPA